MTPTATAILTSATYTAAHPLVTGDGTAGLCAGLIFLLLTALIVAVGAGKRKARRG